MKRRDFVEGLGRGLAGTAMTTLFDPATVQKIQAATQRAIHLTPQEIARDESFWLEIQQAFSINRSILNLDNGNVCPSPRMVTEAMVRYTWQQQDAPAYMMYEVLKPLWETVRAGLARLLGCDPEEIAIVRNTTEALDNVLLGVDLRPGAEILTTTQDYFAMHMAIDQRCKREGIVKKAIAIPAPPKSMDELAEAFERAITPKTRLILVSHPVNLTGQLFPIKRICEVAHQKGIEVVVDGAQSFAHLDYKLADLGCDYFGTSLHKWLYAPIGTGLLYVPRDRIGKVWSLFPTTTPFNPKYQDDIRKFEDVGTQSSAQTVAISQALAFHNLVGSKRKEERLRYLTHYWADKVKALPNIRFLTSFSPEMSCGLASFELTGTEPAALKKYLWERHKIIVQSITSRRAPEIKAVRVTPNIYTMLSELDYFCEVLEFVAKRGLPKSS